MFRSHRFTLAIGTLATVFLFTAHGAKAIDSAGMQASPAPSLSEEIVEGFSYRLNATLYGRSLKPATSVLNPLNMLEIPRYQASIQLRPDFFLDIRNIQAAFKPRLETFWEEWNDGLRDGDTDTNTEAFVNEWWLRYGIADKLFLSYGRENLQWGPSFLFSPSNPFNPRNGRNNPFLELSGLGYGRAVWVPNSRWSLSAIANTDKGSADPLEPFDKSYAIKLDYTGDGAYVSLIGSHRDEGHSAFGFYGGRTISDALLLHAEGSITESNGTKVLAGGSYTFENAGTLIIEYYHNSDGCNEDKYYLCFPPFGNSSKDEVLSGRNYLFAQYYDIDLFANKVDLTARVLKNMEDNSNIFVGIASYDLNNYSELFTVVNVTTGGGDRETTSLIDYEAMLGVSLSY